MTTLSQIQRRVGVTPDGLWGPATAAAILKALGPELVTPIDLLFVAVLRAACPERSEAQLAPWVEPIRKACQRFRIDTIRRIAAFVAQMAHESGLVPGREENLNYSAKRLTEVWPSRFPTIAMAASYAGNPDMLANRVYANRMGNGNEASGDGWRFRGAGPMQLTGRANWTGFASAMGMTLEAALNYGRTLEGGIMAAAWFWHANGINELADTPGVTDETRAINGGTHGLADRTARFDRAVAAMLAAERAA
ncbi:MAG TPA: hypothetical protein VF695_06280 [Sphingomonas sp.]